jgi:hypothetical protein
MAGRPTARLYARADIPVGALAFPAFFRVRRHGIRFERSSDVGLAGLERSAERASDQPKYGP